MVKWNYFYRKEKESNVFTSFSRYRRYSEGEDTILNRYLTWGKDHRADFKDYTVSRRSESFKGQSSDRTYHRHGFDSFFQMRTQFTNERAIYEHFAECNRLSSEGW